jgi:aminoglycoside phosphotransferase (APT) family kinase protein
MSLLDLGRLGGWLDAHGLEPGLPIDAEPLGGGASNVMFTVRRGASRWVLRRPPAVAVTRADDGIRREYRLLEALAGTDVPHPRVVALCEDHAVLGCTFFLMEEVDGVPAETIAGEPGAAVAFALIDALAALHGVDWRAAGLGDLGRPEMFHERQVARWTRQLESNEGRPLPGVDRVGEWLEANRPASYEPAIMHGDYHMRNALVSEGSPPRVVAILDWETATIGDPLLDLAGFCEIVRTRAPEGWPADRELVERYVAMRGVGGIPDIRYYAVLYNFRLAILLDGIYQRSLRDASRADQHTIGDFAVAAIARALDLAEGRADAIFR